MLRKYTSLVGNERFNRESLKAMEQKLRRGYQPSRNHSAPRTHTVGHVYTTIISEVSMKIVCKFSAQSTCWRGKSRGNRLDFQA